MYKTVYGVDGSNQQILNLLKQLPGIMSGATASSVGGGDGADNDK